MIEFQPNAEWRGRHAVAAKELLDRASQPLELVLDDIKDYAIFTIGLDGGIASWNAGAERMKGYTPEEAIGMPFERLFTPEEVAAGQPSAEMEIARTKGVYSGEGERMKKDGSRFYADVVLRRIESDDGDVLGFVKITRDITERKRLEEAARASARFQEEVLGIVSHDLRNPINVIHLSAQALLSKGRLDPADARAVTRIEAATRRAVRLISDLLDYTQVRFGSGLTIQPDALDAHDLTRAIAEDLRLTHAGRELVVETHGDGAVQWDPDRTRQLVVNLVNNAFAHGGKDAAVTISTRGSTDSMTLEVHNWGEPIPSGSLSKLFDAFSQRDAAGAERGSIGLGLFIVKGIVTAHRGSIAVQSTREAGTTFSVTLPRRVRASIPALPLGD